MRKPFRAANLILSACVSIVTGFGAPEIPRSLRPPGIGFRKSALCLPDSRPAVYTESGAGSTINFLASRRLRGAMSALLKVECYAGHKADERPRRFSFIPARPLGRARSGDATLSRIYEVDEVLDRWYGPDYECFKVRANDANLYVLRHHLGEDAWSLDAFRRGPAPLRRR